MMYFDLLIILLIKFFIFTHSLHIIKLFFNNGNSQYKYQWSNVSEHETNFQRRDELTHTNYQEEEVVEEFELVEKDYWDQRNDVVLLIILLVSWKSGWDTRTINV